MELPPPPYSTHSPTLLYLCSCALFSIFVCIVNPSSSCLIPFPMPCASLSDLCCAFPFQLIYGKCAFMAKSLVQRQLAMLGQ